METESGKRGKESGVRNRRYSIRYPFAAEVEMLELKSGSRVSGVTSDLSLGGCFMCVRRTLEVGARVRGTLTRDGQKVGMLAVVRVVKPHAGMGLEFLDIDPDSNYCCHGSKIFANRTETSLTSGGVHHMTEDVPGQQRRYT